MPGGSRFQTNSSTTRSSIRLRTRRIFLRANMATRKYRSCSVRSSGISTRGVRLTTALQVIFGTRLRCITVLQPAVTEGTNISDRPKITCSAVVSRTPRVDIPLERTEQLRYLRVAMFARKNILRVRKRIDDRVVLEFV